MRNRWLNLVTLLGLMLIIGAQPAHAVCTNPDGVAGSIVFNKDHQVMQYCDDTNWQQVGPSPSGPQGCPNIGNTCTDGSIYAGLSPDGNVAMYTTPADAGQFSWNDGTTNYVDTAMQNCLSSSPGAEASCQTGEANTALLVALGTTPSPAPYVAARHCDNLDAHGQTDWHLPAQDELNVLWVNRVAIGGFNVTGSFPAGHYWSSSELDNNNASLQRFSDGNQLTVNKASGLSVRCVRKQATQLTSIVPDGLVGHWKLDETSGTTAVDSSGNGNDGTMVGGMSGSNTVDGMVSTAIHHTNSNHYIQIPHSATLNVTGNQMTLSAWVNTNNVQFVSIISKRASGGTNVFRLDQGGAGSPFQCIITTTNGDQTVSFYLPREVWTHVTCVYDGTQIRVYVNGGEVASAGATGSIVSVPTADVYLFKTLFSYNRYLLGYMDDVRIYDRALTAEEIKYLYKSFDANITYDADRRVPKYFNGDDWVAAGPVRYAPNAVNMDGVTDYLNTNSINSSNSTRITMSGWINTDVSYGTVGMIMGGEFSRAMNFGINSSNRLSWYLYGPVNTNAFNCSNALTIGSWHHFLLSYDSSNQAATRLYINDVECSTINWDPFTADAEFYGGNASFVHIGARHDAGWKFDGKIADLWIDYDSYLDFSIEANRRKFIDAGGDPVFLGANGQLPTGSPPEIFLSGETDTWHTNKGTGGGFTENGALTDAVTIPRSTPLMSLPQGCPSFGDVCDDGTFYVGLSPDGDVEMYAAPQDAPGGNIYQWNNDNASGHVTTNVTNTITGEANTRTLVTIDSDSITPGFQPHVAAQYCYDLVSNGANDWYLPGRNELGLLFSNGDHTLLGLLTGAVGDLSTSYWNAFESSNTHARRQNSAGTGTNLKEADLNVRCVRKGPAPRCQNPDRPNGSIVYNADNNVMQYCDPWSGGNGWQAMGP